MCNNIFIDSGNDKLETYQKYCPNVSSISAIGGSLMMSDTQYISFFIRNVKSDNLLSYQSIDSMVTKLKSYMDTLDDNNKQHIKPIFENLVEKSI